MTEYHDMLVSEIDSRIAYEVEKNADSLSIQKTLNDIRKAVSFKSVADVMCAANVDAAFINRAERSNARFNVYAAEKVVNVARAAAKLATLNHYTLAILRSALALEANQMTLTQRDAVAACSIDMKLADAKRDKILVKYQKHVHASTASTQASSSINALKMYNVLRESRDDANQTVFTIVDCDFTKALRESVNI